MQNKIELWPGGFRVRPYLPILTIGLRWIPSPVITDYAEVAKLPPPLINNDIQNRIMIINEYTRLNNSICPGKIRLVRSEEFKEYCYCFNDLYILIEYV